MVFRTVHSAILLLGLKFPALCHVPYKNNVPVAECHSHYSMSRELFLIILIFTSSS